MDQLGKPLNNFCSFGGGRRVDNHLRLIGGRGIRVYFLGNVDFVITCDEIIKISLVMHVVSRTRCERLTVLKFNTI